MDFNATIAQQTLIITGTLGRTNADLKATFNGKDVGTVVVTGTETHSDYEIHLHADLPSPWKFDWKGSVDIAHGNYPIEKPSNAVDIESVLPKSSTNDSSGAVDLENL